MATRSSHLVVDSEKAGQWRRKALREQRVAERRQNLKKNEESNAQSVAPDAGRDTSDVLSRMGRPMTGDEVRKRLALCNRNLVFERSINYPELTGIYILKDGQKVHICGMQTGFCPELTVYLKKDINLPDSDLFGAVTPTRDVQWKKGVTYDDEVRGWRKVLEILLHAGLITVPDINKHFGAIPTIETQRWKVE